MRAPRAQSAAAMGFLPGAAHLAERDGVGGRTDADRRLSTATWPGRSDVSSGTARDRAEPDPLVAEDGSRRRAQGCRRGPAGRRVTAGWCQSTRASATVILGASDTPSVGCGRRDEGPPLESVHRRHQQLRTRDSESFQQVRAGVGGAYGLGRHAVDRTGVQALLQQERRRPGHVVAVPDRVLHGGGAPPGGQQREVQVDPAVPGDVQRDTGYEGAVRHDRAAVGRERRESREEAVVPWSRRPQHLDAGVERSLRHRGRDKSPTPAGGCVGAGEHRDDVVAGAQQRVERGQCGRRRAGEDESHAATSTARTAGAG